MRILKLLVLILFLWPFSAVNAQVNSGKHAVGIHQEIHDFNVRLLDGKWSSFDSALSQTIRFSYFSTIKPSWTFCAGLSGGFLHHQERGDIKVNKTWSTGLDAAVQWNMNNGRLLKESSLISPFFTFGYDLDYLPGYKKEDLSPWALRNLYGAGLNIRAGKKSAVQFQAGIEQELGGDFQTQIIYRFGWVQKLGQIQSEFAGSEQKFEDRDGDGLADRIDRCPDEPGIAECFGCPKVFEHAMADTIEVQVISPRIKEDRSLMDTVSVSDTTIKAVIKDTEIDTSARRDTAEITPETTDTVSKQIPTEVNKTWYVIIFSASNVDAAKKVEQKAIREFSSVVLLPQPNGYVRVGVPATTEKVAAEKLMYAIRQQGYPKAWLWRQ